MKSFTLKIQAKKVETPDAVTICFKQPALKKIQYVAGQYLTVIVRINGRRYLRPYSFSSAPGVDNTLDITIKRCPQGIVSNHIIDTFEEGQLIEVMSPLGDFTFEKIRDPNDKRFILWGAGSGITPLYSLIKAALKGNLFKHVTLVYGNRSNDTIIFKKSLEELQSQYESRFSIWHFHTRLSVASSNPFLIQGRIDPEKIMDVLRSEGNMENSVHFICGPSGLKESVKASLQGFRIDESRIFSEDFELIRNPEDFKNISTQNVLVNFNGAERSVEVVKGKSILESALDSMIELPYSCQIGNCSICKAKVLAGEVSMIGLQKRPVDLTNDECLLCCSFPQSNNVKVLI
ncbi:2Fe-2S iron-sulfur cluster binding domain-containing protein [Pedobacter sp. HMF7647]|uniref:2Fe-2S iron-sulfur cluster binding domain-containing protein n=1 Tax=Hufsiella arboris TaxID=2695275 RepID=A0A7K1YCC5_9SPHI|nr:ferredoxin--NADP reductase [Hufsiella arboris]MXV51698.1 2Fe-2S iron-sulfur cluster binding domain-containing protein [Hufsiella arboris]